MRKPLLGHTLIVAALVVAFAGGASARAVIDGHDIKKSSITGKQVKNGSLRLKDLKANDVAALHGADGVNGTNAASGAGGFGPPPSGTTVTGFANQLWQGLKAGQVVRYYVSLPFTTVAPLTVSGNLWFHDSAQVAPAESSQACSGTAAAPTAPPGQLCVYLASVSNVADDSAVLFQGAGIGGTGDDTHGFIVSPAANMDGSMSFAVAWAYTAP